jgi:hypothetical protein
MSEKLPIDLVSLTELMRSPLILRIVTILDKTSLSIEHKQQLGRIFSTIKVK